VTWVRVADDPAAALHGRAQVTFRAPQTTYPAGGSCSSRLSGAERGKWLLARLRAVDLGAARVAGPTTSGIASEVEPEYSACIHALSASTVFLDTVTLKYFKPSVNLSNKTTFRRLLTGSLNSCRR
jgi:hypothetical protein